MYSPNKTYNSIIFDCDGVILNSNAIKSGMFKTVLSEFGDQAVEEYLDFHKESMGVSRFGKFNYFVENILPKTLGNLSATEKEYFEKYLLAQFATQIQSALKNCEIAKDIDTLRSLLPNSDWYVVSGGVQSELRSTFKNRNIDHLFNGGIYGSPADKYSISENLIRNMKIQYPVLSIGDSILDYKVSQKHNFDFVFLSEWTEASNWKSYFANKEICTFLNISGLCGHIYTNTF